MISFEFDETKSKSNLKKHGIGFDDARRLWEDPDLLEIPVTTVDEPRSLVIGRIDSNYWSAVITHRGENIRIISFRGSRKSEVAIYES